MPNIGIRIKTDTDIKLLTNAIVRSGSALLREAGRLFKPHRISAAQFNVLNLLADAPEGMRPSVLASELVVDPSSATYVIDRMEAMGWLKRADDGRDRRAWRIVLTAAGRALHRDVAPLYVSALREMLHGLDPGRVVALTAALDGIQQAASAAVNTVLAAQPKKRHGSVPGGRS
jgi:DNA-binding MarR family transcriptional regulator